MLGHGREVYCDELDYTEAAKTVVLRATKADRRVVVIVAATGADSEASRIQWDLAKDRLEIDHLGGALPVPK